MPAYRDREARRLYMREYRRRKKTEAAAAEAAAKVVPLVLPDDPVGALAAWARDTLIVPRGHPLAGEPMALPDFAVDFLRASWGAHESALTMGGRTQRAAIAAVLALGHLVGPLRTDGWRGAVVESQQREGERVEEPGGGDRGGVGPGRRDPASALSRQDHIVHRHPRNLGERKDAGHSSSFDLVVVDETGLMPERSRELLAGLRSSVSAKGGRIMHISACGATRPLFAEVLDNPAVVIARVYAAAPGCCT